MIGVATIQAYLGVSGQEAYLAQLEVAAVSDVQVLTGRWLGAPKPFQDVRDIAPQRFRLTAPEDGRRLQSVRLSQPVPQLSDLTIEQRRSPVSEWETLEHETDDDPPRAAFELEGHRLYRLKGTFPAGQRAVRISYEFGYATDAGPADFTAVTLDLIAARYASPMLRKLGGRVTTASIRGASFTVSDGRGYGIPEDLCRRILALRPAGSF